MSSVNDVRVNTPGANTTADTASTTGTSVSSSAVESINTLNVVGDPFEGDSLVTLEEVLALYTFSLAGDTLNPDGPQSPLTSDEQYAYKPPGDIRQIQQEGAETDQNTNEEPRRLTPAAEEALISGLRSLYVSLLGYEPDQSTIQRFKDSLNRGVSLQTIYTQLINSPEYQKKLDMMNTAQNTMFVPGTNVQNNIFAGNAQSN